MATLTPGCGSTLHRRTQTGTRLSRMPSAGLLALVRPVASAVSQLPLIVCSLCHLDGRIHFLFIIQYILH